VKVGGATAVFQFADGLARLGHDVVVVHQSFLGSAITRADDVWWHQFHPATEHVYGDVAGSFDAVVGVDGQVRPDLGRPFMWVQARGLLPALDDVVFGADCAKLCTSTWLVDAALAHGSGPCYHVPYGIDHDRFRSRVPWEERDRVVAALYHDHPLKGTIVAIAAMQEVRGRMPDTRFLMFGNVVAEPSLPEWIEYHHDPRQERIVELYNQASVWLQSSIVEGFGLTAVEAMACGAVLVSTDCGGSRDYASSDTAFVSASHDPRDVAAALLDALQQPDRAARLARNGRTFVQRFDWQRSAVILERALSA
jgi:glycosyltransferase involved in cell wall biosynthesis